MAKSRFTRKWIGPTIQENFLFRPLIGGAYKKGGAFNLIKPQTKTGMIFSPRYYQVNVTEFLEDLEVEMAGPTLAFSVIKTDMAEAALTMSAIQEIAFYRHGQTIAGDDRSAELNGLEEMLTTTAGTTWTGATFPSYGGQTRADVAPALNSPVGLVPANLATLGGAIGYRILLHSYLSCVVGGEHPQIGITTNRGFGFIAETFTPQQQIDVVQPEINWPGFKFMQSTIVASQYCPGADGVNDANLGNYYNATETFWWLNWGPQGDDAFIRFYIAQSSKFAYGFTGFKGARGDNQVSGQLLFGGNLTGRAPRYSRVLYGFTR